jgi:hypothetical protein
MRTADHPIPPDEGPLRAGPPDLAPVGRRDGLRPTIAVVVAVALVLALAVWKPWESSASSANAPLVVPPGAAGALLPAITSRPDNTGPPASAATPAAAAFAGLDLSAMGTVDPHGAWGVAVGYVSKEQFDIAARGTPIVTPADRWLAVEPGQAAPGPVVDQAGGTSVALAVTWPALPGQKEPVSLRLFRSSGPSSDPTPGTEVQLGTTLDEVVGSGAGATPHGGIGSGRFFTPPALSEDVVAWPNTGWPASWPSHGWPAGRYEFRVDLGDGESVTLPFVIAFGRVP